MGLILNDSFEGHSEIGVKPSEFKVGDWVLSKGTLYQVRKPYTFSGSNESPDLLYLDHKMWGADDFVQAVLAFYGMRQTEEGRYMLDTGSMVKAIIEMKYTIRDVMKNMSEQNEVFIETLADSIKEVHSDRGKIERYSILSGEDDER